MSPLSLILLLGFHAPPGNHVALVQLYQSQTAAASNDLSGQQAGESRCFTMRSYIFHRQDGNAPVLVGTTTCTPAAILQSRRVESHKPRLVLLDQPRESR